jgi:G3E family GTPase
LVELYFPLLSFFVDEDIREMYTLDGIITVADAKHIIVLASTMRSPRASKTRPSSRSHSLTESYSTRLISWRRLSWRLSRSG